MAASAADWLARRDAGFSPEEARGFRDWCDADPRHRVELERVEAAWRLLQSPQSCDRSEEAIVTLAARHRARVRRRGIALGATTVGLAAAITFMVFLSPPAAVEHVVESSRTALVPAPRQELEDGSIIVLSPGARVAVDFSPALRSVQLLSGEAHFSVAKDPRRPFVVTAGGVQARAVGTEFAVRFGSVSVEVLVNEGHVAIARDPARLAAASATAEPIPAAFVAAAGTRVTLPLDAAAGGSIVAEQVSSADLARALAWRGGRTEFAGTPLADAIAVFNQHNRVQISLADESLGQLRVSGAFWSDHPAGFARLVAATFGLDVRTIDEQRLELGR